MIELSVNGATWCFNGLWTLVIIYAIWWIVIIRRHPAVETEIIETVVEEVEVKPEPKPCVMKSTIDAKDKLIKDQFELIEQAKADLSNLKKEIADDRKSWDQQKKTYNSKIGKLEDKVSELEMLLDAMPEPLQITVEGIQPENPDAYMLYHSCKRKTPYNSAEIAKVNADVLGAHFNKSFKFYECKYCHKWHLATIK